MRVMKTANCDILHWLLLGLLVVGLGSLAVAQSDVPAPPPPPPHDGMMMHGPGPMMGMHEELGDGKVVKGVPLSAELDVTRDTTLADGNRIHNENQTKI